VQDSLSDQTGEAAVEVVPYDPSWPSLFDQETHHLHLVPRGGRLWSERLAFRDCLRRDAAVAAEYAALKQRLARQYRFEREAYTDAKEPFIRKALEACIRSF
jgi:GrpB-like predicted nucleotidyltransferase (UPF0157 family)